MPGEKGPKLKASLDSRLSHLLVGMTFPSERGHCKITPLQMSRENQLGETQSSRVSAVSCVDWRQGSLFFFGPGLS